MKNSKKILALLILFVSVAMFSILPATASVLNEAQKHTTDDNSIQIEAKFKKVTSYKITFNGNGGKIGKKTKVAKNIKKGTKIKKFPATPKRSGYTFKGWYTKKKSGKKISVNTKPTKSVTVYAYWTKTKSTSKILGNWQWEGLEYGLKDLYGNQQLHTETMIYNFTGDGRFQFFDLGGGYTPEKFEGKYSVSNGKMYLKNMKWYKLSGTTEQNIDKFGANYRKWSWGLIRESSKVMTTKYKFGSDRNGNYLEIAYPRVDADPNYIYPGEKFYKT